MIAIFLCDEWKSVGSMRLIGISSNLDRIKISIAELLKNKVIEVEDGMDNFDWNIYELNNSFKYLYLIDIEENEIFTDGSYWA